MSLVNFFSGSTSSYSGNNSSSGNSNRTAALIGGGAIAGCGTGFLMAGPPGAAVGTPIGALSGAMAAGAISEGKISSGNGMSFAFKTRY